MDPPLMGFGEILPDLIIRCTNIIFYQSVVEITDLLLFLKMLSMFLGIQHVQVGKSDEGEGGGSNSNLTIVALPIAIILGAVIVLIVLALLRIRSRKMKKKRNIKPNEV